MIEENITNLNNNKLKDISINNFKNEDFYNSINFLLSKLK